MRVFGTKSDKEVFDRLNALAKQRLGRACVWHELPKISQKTLSQHATGTVLAVLSGKPMLMNCDDGLIKTAPNWQALTKRIVSAGRKSELLLQACKVSKGMMIQDAMAGFGHDGLLLASTGARVLMTEQNPLVALLLWYEYDVMTQNTNWQKLLDRISIACADFLDTDERVDVVYLDPMFPTGSYDAKVGKTMQLLHTLTTPPSLDVERFVLGRALATSSKVVVKRPLSAPFLAGKTPCQSVHNNAIRFDVYAT